MNAYRGSLALLGFGLVALWLVGLGTQNNLWLTWLDGIAGACSLVVAGMGFSGQEAPMRSATAWLMGLAVTLFALWVVGLVAADAPDWLAWTTFGFAIAYLFAGIGLGTRAPRGITSTTITRPI